MDTQVECPLQLGVKMCDESAQNNVLMGHQDQGKPNLKDTTETKLPQANLPRLEHIETPDEVAYQCFKDGKLLEKKGELGEAMMCYQKSLELKPQLKFIHDFLKDVSQKIEETKDLVCDQFSKETRGKGKMTIEEAIQMTEDFKNDIQPSSRCSISEICKKYRSLHYAALYKSIEYMKTGNDNRAKRMYELYELLCDKVMFDIASFTVAEVHENQHNCYWDDVTVRTLVELTEVQLLCGKIPTVKPHPVVTYLPCSPECARKVAEYYAKSAKAKAEMYFNTLTNDPGLPALKMSQTSIKICYVSSDIKDHSLTHLIAGVFPCHKRPMFEVTVIALNEDDGSEFRKRVEKDVDTFYDASKNEDRELVEVIKSHGCDILVNLNGYTNGSRNELFALKLAKVQVMWLGFPGTSGSDYIDYIISDKITSPQMFESHFSERVAYLPGSHFVGDHARLYKCVQKKIILLKSKDFVDSIAVMNVDDLECARQAYKPQKVKVVCSPVNGVTVVENDAVEYDVVDFTKLVQQLEIAQSELVGQSEIIDQSETVDRVQEQKFKQYVVTTRQQYGLPDNAIVFCNFCQSYKYDKSTLRMWLCILCDVPKSVLWLLIWVDEARENIIAYFTNSGIDKDRIIFTPVLEKEKYIIALQLADIFLDTPLVNGHTTIMDVLWAGVPVVTLPGVKMASRIAASLVDTIGCAQLIANNEDSYIEIAIQLGRNTKLLQSVRARIYKGREDCSLFNTEKFTQNLEELFLWMLLAANLDHMPESGHVMSQSGLVKVQESDPINGRVSSHVRLLESSPVRDSAQVSVLESKENYENLFLGSFHQGDVQFPEYSRGRQCTANAICALLYVRYKQLFSKEDLDNVLEDGDMIYRHIIADLKSKGLFKCGLLSFEDMPSHIELFSSRFQVVKHDIISGIAVQASPNLSLPSLNSSIESALQISPTVLLIIGSVCSAVFMKDNLYCFFDSHAHGPDGLSSCGLTGYSVLISFAKFEHLVSYLHSLYSSMHIELTSPFDILPVEFSEVPLEHTCHPASN